MLRVALSSQALRMSFTHHPVCYCQGLKRNKDWKDRNNNRGGDNYPIRFYSFLSYLLDSAMCRVASTWSNLLCLLNVLQANRCKKWLCNYSHNLTVPTRAFGLVWDCFTPLVNRDGFSNPTFWTGRDYYSYPWNLCSINPKISWALAILWEHMHKKFIVNQTKIRGSCQMLSKIALLMSYSNLPLAAHWMHGRHSGGKWQKWHPQQLKLI